MFVKKIRMKKFIFFLIISVFVLRIHAQNVHTDYFDGVVYYKIKPSAQMHLPPFEENSNPDVVFEKFPAYASLVKLYGIQEIKCPFQTQTPDVQNIYRIRFQQSDKVDELCRTLMQFPEAEYAEMSPILKLFNIPDDPDTAQQYYLDNINAWAAWGITTGSHDIKIAIVDDGCRVTHPDLIANIWINPGEIAGNSIDDDGNGYIDDVSGWDAADEDNDPNVLLSPPAIWGEMAFTHGTHCSGLAAGTTNNGIGIAAVSYNVSLIPIKTVTDASWIPISIETPAEGVDYAIAAGAHIVSMSFGGEQASGFATLETLINAGHDLGIIFVAAAGNNGDGSGGLGTPNAINYPAGFTNVLAVGATDQNDVKPGFSQYGDWIDVMAPGVGIYSTLAWSSPYGNQDGTSMACPIVAGAIGLLKSYQPFATKEQIISCLKLGCDNIDSVNPAYVDSMGSGRINVYNSLVCLQQYQYITIDEENECIVFPNPATDYLMIHFENNDNRQIQIVDINSRIVYETKSNGNKIYIELSDLATGMYIVKVTRQENVTYQKFIKTNP